MKLYSLRSLSTLSLLCCLGCAASATVQRKDPPAPPAPLPTAPPPKEADDKDGLSVSGGFGQVDEAEVEEQFRGRLSEINRCYQEALQRQWFLSGRVELKLRVGKDGAVSSAAVVQSTLGCYEVERCVAQIAQGLRFQPPKGGEAELTYPVEFPARAAVRSWPEERVASSMARHRGEIGQCQGQRKPGKALKVAGRAHAAGGRGAAHAAGGRGAAPLRVTVYIGPGGRVASAGLAADDPIDERLGSCLITRALAWRFDDPLGQLVKASYAFD